MRSDAILLFIAIASQSLSATKLHGIAVKNRHFADGIILRKPYANFIHPAHPNSTQESLTACAEFASSRGANKFVLDFEIHGFTNENINHCQVYNTADTNDRDFTIGRKRQIFASCDQRESCTTATDFRAKKDWHYRGHPQSAISEPNLSFQNCLEHVARLNRARQQDQILHQIQWSEAANGETTCKAPVGDILVQYETSYVGWIAAEESASIPRDLSCSSPFVVAQDLADCVSFSWNSSATDTVWSRFTRWRSSSFVPDYPSSYRPPPPIKDGKPYHGISLQYNLLNVASSTRLDIAAFKRNVRVIPGPYYIYEQKMKALTATEAIQECAQQAQNKFYRTFSIVQRYENWKCSLIWEEIGSVANLLVKDDLVLWGFVYSASLNSTNHA